MDSYEELARSLDNEYGPDYWSDYVKLRVGEQLDALGDEDWSRLEKGWRGQSAGWRVRLAEASTLSDKPRVVGLLVGLLESPEPEVGSAAAEALLEKDYTWSPEAPIGGHLRRHLGNASPEQRAPIERLLSHIPE
jgi:hypothetical protein